MIEKLLLLFCGKLKLECSLGLSRGQGRKNDRQQGINQPWLLVAHEYTYGHEQWQQEYYEVDSLGKQIMFTQEKAG